MGMGVWNNIMSMNGDRMLGLTKSARAKSTERLSSGYKINRAADDAAGLAMSEKMRRLIRGLAQGTQNAQDGVSWVQTGDGALEEAQDILQRMSELSVKSLNGTNSEGDREMMDAEFAQLKTELDRIGTTTVFNEMNIFSNHKTAYYQCEGAVRWEPNQIHAVTEGQNDLTFRYRRREDGPQETVTFIVPPGEYTTMELLETIDDVISEEMDFDHWFELEYTGEGFINATLEGGCPIDEVAGSLSYLLYDMYRGGSPGALIGTTIFPNETLKLDIVTGENDDMTFTVDYFAGNTEEIHITVPEGSYNRQELIDYINGELQGKPITASAHGTGIKLGSYEAIVTGFKGNMFKIETQDPVYNSIFYDNILYGDVRQYQAVLTGGYVLTTDSRDLEHQKIILDSTNNVLSFTPNSMGDSFDLTFDPGEYTIDDICTKMNDFFTGNSLDLKASVISQSTSSGVDKSVTFKGLKIISGMKGPDSAVGLDRNSSAYDALFVSRVYNQYGDLDGCRNETTPNRDAVYTGGRSLSGMSSSSKLTLTSANNRITLTLKGTDDSASVTDTITLAAKGYTSLGDLIGEINTQIGNSASFKGLITASASADGKIVLKGADGKNIDTLTVNGSSNSYNTLFVGSYTRTDPVTTTQYGAVTLPGGTPNGGSMTIRVNGEYKTVNIPAGAGGNDVADAINSQLKASETTTINKFTDTGTVRGTSGSRTSSGTGSGNTSTRSWSGSAAGQTETKQGEVGYKTNNPAVLEVDITLPGSMKLDGTNNRLQLTVNNQSKTITLDEGEYSQQELADALQAKIDETFGEGWGGAAVSLEEGRLRLEARLPEGKKGSDTNIKCGTSDSSLLRDLNTTKNPAVCTTSLMLDSRIAIDGASNKLTFSYTEGGNMTPVELTLTPGTYTPETMINQINTQLGKTGTGITASLTDGKLTLTSGTGGDGVRIDYNSTNGGSSASVLFGDLNSASPATLVLNQNLQSAIKVENGKNELKLTVGGTQHTLLLEPGSSYSRSGFVDMVNRCLQKQGIGATAFLSGSRLGFRTTATGSSATLSASYDDSEKSAMPAIWGSNTVTTPGVNAVWDGKNLTLTAVNAKGGSMSNIPISVSSGSSGGMLPPRTTTVTTYPSGTSGYHSRMRSYIDGAPLKGDVEIDKWCDELKFTFMENGTNKEVSIKFEESEYKTYPYTELQQKLQEKIDKALGAAGKITVKVDADGVRLEASEYGNRYQFKGSYVNGAFRPDCDGDFYWKIMRRCDERDLDQPVNNKDGTQDVEKAIAMGRKDVRNESVEINAGISDELSLDLTVNGTVHTLRMTLAPGRYSGDALAKQVQEKLDEQLLKEGFHAGLIQVTIGGYSSGVSGANDQNALQFGLSKEIAAPEEGDYIIDGISGNAAFEIFYQTDGKMIPAYTMGTKDVRNGVTIKPGETDLSFDVDGTVYTVTLDQGFHTAENLRSMINERFDEADIPLAANIDVDSGRLKVSYKQMGEHEIRSVSGKAKEEVFFNENGAFDDTERHVQLSSEIPDHIVLPRSEFSAGLLRIRSLKITEPKYAEKAVNRISAAMARVSSLRSAFGSTQNRLEHAINNNRNKEENLQSAESVIRDADMAKEMMDFAMSNILEQAGLSILAQSNKSGELVLGLLQ